MIFLDLSGRRFSFATLGEGVLGWRDSTAGVARIRGRAHLRHRAPRHANPILSASKGIQPSRLSWATGVPPVVAASAHSLCRSPVAPFLPRDLRPRHRSRRTRRRRVCYRGPQRGLRSPQPSRLPGSNRRRSFDKLLPSGHRRHFRSNVIRMGSCRAPGRQPGFHPQHHPWCRSRLGTLLPRPLLRHRFQSLRRAQTGPIRRPPRQHHRPISP